ncbi:MAG: tyrosine-type recombinase/integrase [Brasilonema angustatum HA4187-MV1]|nr:tyrosine-type recombinase/integrase [Brasilonema angustatum HA4187-MV1]
MKLVEMWLHGKSPKTVAAYQWYCTNFLAFLAKPLREVTLEDMYDYSAHLANLGLAPNTQKTCFYAIKSLISFAHTVGFIPFNVGSAMKLKKTADRLNERILTPKEVQKILWATEESKYRYKKEKQRDLLILKLLYIAGLRVSELTGLASKNLTARGDTGQVTVLGKGDKTRSILLPKDVWVELMEFVGDADENSPVFASRGGGKGKVKAGGHLDRTQVYRIVEAATQRAGIKKKVSPHWLRHAHASHSLEAGADIKLLQQTLGHDNVSTTSRYLSVRPDSSTALYLSV